MEHVQESIQHHQEGAASWKGEETLTCRESFTSDSHLLLLLLAGH